MVATLERKQKHFGKDVSLPRRIANLTAFAFVLFYLGLSPYLFYNAFEFFPRKLDVSSYAPSSVPRETVFFKAANGANISAWYFPVPGSRYTAIIHHGQGENIAYKPYYNTAMVLRDAGVSVLLYDYEGFGASEGRPSNDAMRRDGQAANDYLVREKSVDKNHIVHVGVSLGTGPASDIAASNPCAGVILLSPYLSLSKLATHHLPFLRIYPALLFPQPDLGCERLLGTGAGTLPPVLVIHGDNDFLIPISNSDKFCAAYQGPLTYIRVPMGYHVGSLWEGPQQEGNVTSLTICRKFFDSLH